MRYKLLGRSGLRVSELCLGTMTFGEDWGWGASEDESRRIFDAFAAAGGNFVDTSNNYTNGSSERIVGACIAAERERFVVATKYTLSTRQDDPNAGGNHRKNLMQALHASLRRLNSDYVDLYWLHMWDFLTPVEEVMRALDDVVRAGQVLYVGISDTPAWVVAQANTLAEWRGWSRLVALQLPYSLGTRDAERELLPMARAFEMAVTPWGLLEGGELTGKYNQPARKQAKQGNDQVHGPRRNSRASRENLALAGELVALGAEIGRSPSQIAINWVRQQPQHAPMIPIVGARSAAQLADNLGCLDWQLTPEQLQRLDAASAIPLGFPQSFLGSEHVGELIFGNTRALIDNHRG